MKKSLLIGISLVIAGLGTVSAREFQSTESIKKNIDPKHQEMPLRIKNNPAVATRAYDYPEASGEWTEWSVYGTGTLTLMDIEDMYNGDLENYNGEYSNKTLYCRQDANNQNIQQFKLEGLFNNADVLIDYYPDQNNLLKIYPQPTNTDNFMGEVEVMDLATCYEIIDDPEGYGMTAQEYAELIDVFNEYNYFVPSLGRLYVYLGFMVPGDIDACGVGDLMFQLEGFDSFVPVLDAESFYSTENAEMYVGFTEKAPYAKYIIKPGFATNNYLQLILDGSPEVKTLTESGKVLLEVDEYNMLYTIMVVTYDDNNEAMELSYAYFTVASEESDQWKSLGNTTVTTDILASLFGEEPPVFEVEIQENVNTPGLYRYVNIFTDKYPFNEEGDYDTQYSHYLIVDATNPDFVLVAPQSMGCDWGGGYFSITGVSSYFLMMGYSESAPEVINYVGSFKDGKITFPANSFGIYCPRWSVFGGEDGSIYTVNTSGEMCLTVPSDAGVDEITDSNSNLPVHYYNLQGIEIPQNDAKGIVIKKQGDTVKKIMVK